MYPRLRVGIVSTFPPTRCGIARFSADLVDAIRRVAPRTDLHVVRLVGDTLEETPAARSLDPVAEIDPGTRVGIQVAARVLNQCDVALIQHEFGIFGGAEGRAVVDLTDRLQVPVVSVLHTVRSKPTPGQRHIVEHLHRRGTLVVMCETARTILGAAYGVPDAHVQVIHHGAHLAPQPVNPTPRRGLITWGLLGPGKGLERAIAAMVHLGDLRPAPRYVVVGRTHPVVYASQGTAYRRSVERLVTDLGLDDIVHFVDRYVDEEELISLVRASDVVVVPYDNSEQMSSGVITDALGAARPVVSTRFPYAIEMLGEGSGVVVDHSSPALAAAARALLEDDDRYRRAVDAARDASSRLSWLTSGEKYVRLAHRLATARATA